MRTWRYAVCVFLTVALFMFSAGASEALDLSNTILGLNAGVSLPSSSIFPNSVYNTMIGWEAGFHTTTGSYNTFIGQSAGFYNISGSSNTFVGEGAGSLNLGDYNVFIGNMAGADPLYQYSNNSLIIDNCSRSSAAFRCDMPLIFGDFYNRLVRIDGTLVLGGDVAVASDKRYKKDIHPLEASLDKLMQLQGVSYLWNMEEVKGAGYKKGRQIGLVAQEVEKVFPELVHTDVKGYKALSYDKIVPVLIEAVKEQQKEIKALTQRSTEKDAEIDALRKSILEITGRLAAIENSPKAVAAR